jgi:Transcription elongation factor, GreA/GreB, C-term
MENPPSFPILLGSHVSIELVDAHGEVEVREFTIVAEKQADFRAGLLGENTPLGRLLVGKHAGESLPYKIGDLVEVKILAVTKPSEPIDGVLAEKRRAAVQEAANQSEIINQLIFATARGSKWGEYDVDVDKLLKREDKNDQ